MNRLNRDLLYLGLGIALFTPASIANAKANTDKPEVTRTSEKANLYNKNGKKQISNVKSNSKLEVLGKANDSNLVKVKQGNQVGYIYQQSLKQQTTDNNHLYVVNKAKVHFGSNDSKQTQKLSIDDELKKLGSNKKWTKVKIGNQVGYIKNSAVSQKSRAELDLIKAQKEYNKINHKLQHTKNKKERAKLEKQLSKALKNLERAQKALVKFNNSKMNKDKKSNAKIDNSWINDLINSSSNNNNVDSNNQNNSNPSNGIITNNSRNNNNNNGSENNGQGHNGNNDSSGNNNQSNNGSNNGSGNNDQGNNGSRNNGQGHNENNNGSGNDNQSNNGNNSESGNNGQSNNGNNNESGNNGQGHNGNNNESGNNGQGNNGNNNGSGNDDSSGNNSQGNNETNGSPDNNGQNNDKDPDGNPINNDKNNEENPIDHVGSNGYGQKGTQLYDSENNTQSNVTLGDYNVALGIIGDNGKGRTHVVYNGQEYWVDTDVLSSTPKNYTDDYGFSHYTRYDLSSLSESSKNSDYQVPSFKGLNIQDVPSVSQNDEDHRKIWDSWPLQDANGHEVTYNGYHLVFALAGDVSKSPLEARIQLFYQKVGDENKGLETWHNAGNVLPTSNNSSNDDILKNELHQWSGSSILTNDGIRLLYTSVGTDMSSQDLSTANLDISSDDNGIHANPNNVSDHKSILQSDGKLYLTSEQSKKTLGDNYGLRDPHYYESNGRKYITFQAYSSTDTGAQGSNSLYNMANYGGDDQFKSKEQGFLLNNNQWSYRAQIANSVIGVAELDDNYNVKSINKPLVGLNTANEELERPNMFEHNGKWYLFGVTRGANFASPDNEPMSTYMLGFVADNPNGPFKPLNDNGLVLSSNLSPVARDYNYSYLVLNNHDDNDKDFVVTQFMNYQTFGHSFLLNIDGDKTTVRKDKVMQQGALTKDNAVYYDQSNVIDDRNSDKSNSFSPYSQISSLNNNNNNGNSTINSY